MVVDYRLCQVYQDQNIRALALNQDLILHNKDFGKK